MILAQLKPTDYPEQKKKKTQTYDTHFSRKLFWLGQLK